MAEDPALYAVRAKLRANGIKAATIISRCEELDKNKDDRLHMDDLEAILATLVPRGESFSRREMRALFSAMSNGNERGEVEYSQLPSVLEPHRVGQTGEGRGEERWRDTDFDEEVLHPSRGGARGGGGGGAVKMGGKARGGMMRRKEGGGGGARSGGDVELDAWTTPTGSVGEWLQKAACPAEIKNFKLFIACMERFERETGMRLEQQAGGFVVPLGPDLRVSMQFYNA